MACEAIVQFKCPKNHNQRYKCSEGPLLSCKKCDQEADEVKRKQQRALESQRKQEAQKVEYERKLRELNEQIDSEMEAGRAVEEQKKRQEVLQQKKRDLQEISARNANRLVNSSPISDSMSLLRPLSDLSQTRNTEPFISAASPLPVSVSTLAPSDMPTPLKSPLPTPLDPAAAGLSQAEKEWQRQKDLEGASNEAIDKLMNLTGLEEVKNQVLTIKAKIDLVTRQNASISDERFNICMLGNPGTGMHIYLSRSVGSYAIANMGFS